MWPMVITVINGLRTPLFHYNYPWLVGRPQRRVEDGNEMFYSDQRCLAAL